MAHSSGRIFNWDLWNAEAYERIDHVRNKYDLECNITTPHLSGGVVSGGGGDGHGGTPPASGSSSNVLPHCPTVYNVILLPCSEINIYLTGGTSG